MNNNFYYFSDVEWSRIVGYGALPPERQHPQLWPQATPGDIRINPEGQQEVFREGVWIPRY